MPDILSCKLKPIVLMVALQQASKVQNFENSQQINHMCYSFGTFTLKSAFPWHVWLLSGTVMLDASIYEATHELSVANWLSEIEDGPQSQKL
ncbi:hypothetical protein P3371_24860 [Vibrio parahaemolyticus]|nr:hypothetical protein [Vibrio parahaemolyticus]